jgi:hypothetical protein
MKWRMMPIHSRHPDHDTGLGYSGEARQIAKPPSTACYGRRAGQAKSSTGRRGSPLGDFVLVV